MRMIRRGLGLGLACWLLLLSPEAGATPPPARDIVAVIASSNVGGSDEEPLRYATSDARRMRELLGELGDVRPGNAIIVTADAPEQVLAALRDAQQRIAALAGTGRRTTLVFYYSGHGDDGAIHLAKGALALKDLRAAIDAVHADLRLSILDACRTSGRAKGITLDSAFELQVEPDSPHGTVELRASAVGEAAQESDELGGAVFTHFLVSGLRGGADADGDGRVTLAELYAFAYKKTLLRTTAATVVQHPSMRMDLAGAGEVVLTIPGAATAFIEVPRGPGRYLVFARANASAMGEVSGDGTARIAVPAGKFVVVRRGPASTSVASVDLSGGGTKRMTDGDFRPVAREELAQRGAGAGIELRPMRLETRLGGEVAPASADRLGARAGGALSYSFGRLELELDAAYVGGPFSSAAFDGSVHSIAAGPNLALRLVAGRVTLLPFAGAELRYSWQHLVRVDDARTSAAGFAVTEDRSFASAGPRAGVRASFALGGDWSATASSSYSALLRREVGANGGAQNALHSVLGLTLAVGYAF